MSAFVNVGADTLEVTWPDGTMTPLPYLWLRDNCSCDACRIAQTSEKKFHLASVPANLRPERVKLYDDHLHEVEGGESIIVDGWHIAAELREDHPDLFRILCQTPVPFRIFDEHEETSTAAPMISLDTAGNVTTFRYSNQTMQPMDPTQPGLADFYRAYHEVSCRVMADSARARFRLNGGEILLVAGHRVLHAREAFEPTGRRHLQDAYFEHDNIRNHLAVLARHRKLRS